MKYGAIFLLWISLFSAGYVVSAKAKPNSAISELDQLSDEALHLTRFGRLEEAKSLLVRYGALFAEQGTKDRSFTIAEIRVLTSMQYEALNAVTSISMDDTSRIDKVTAFRLATDAAASKYQPMWAGMENRIIQAFQQVKNAALEGDSVLYNQQLNEFLSIYSIIQPSIKIDLPIEKVQKLDSKMTYLDEFRSKFSDQEWAQQLDDIEVDLNKLFTEINQDEIDPSIWWVIIMTGSIIVTTLSYVSWKKFRGQKIQKKNKKSNH